MPIEGQFELGRWQGQHIQIGANPPLDPPPIECKGISDITLLVNHQRALCFTFIHTLLYKSLKIDLNQLLETSIVEQ